MRPRMNESVVYNHLSPPRAHWAPQSHTEATLLIYIPVGMAIASILAHLASRNPEYTRKFFDAFLSTPTKLVAFLLLGRTPLRYFGYLNHFPLANVIGVGGLGGLGLSIIYLFQRQFFAAPALNAFTVPEVHDRRRKEIELNWALQEEVALQFSCDSSTCV
ncbi:hypothetical protein D9756_003568 [Leucocoprinus leucothites]|uniref:Uncharacterized protein n=1 Tax=Leucocoprinus leucothites TaxID=201217 RepID=A0A8H5G774_9AGAR|nr:hypothetical protein D9756_003568 [Leucoagaricus leucothites]